MKQKRIWVGWIARMVCCFLFIGGMSAKNSADEAASLFQKKQYEEALIIWYNMVQSGSTGAGIYFNIGISESLLHHTPQAILAYEKALRFCPADNRINEALTLERKRIENSVIPVTEFFLLKWIRVVISFLRPGYWALAGLAVLLCLVARFTGLRKNRFIEKFANRNVVIAMITTGIIFIVFAYLSYRQLYRSDEAIIQVRCDFRKAPTEDSPLISAVSPGEKVLVEDQIGNWYQVRLLNLDEGWVKEECLEFILIDETKPTKE